MGLLDRLGWKAKKNNDNLLFKAFYQWLNTGGINWLKNDAKGYIEKGYSENEIVYSIVRLLLSKLTEPPLLLNKIEDDKELKKYKSYLKKGGDSTHRVYAMQFQKKALEEVESHPLIDLLNNPNDYQGQAEFIEAAFGFYKLLGETFIYGIAPENGLNKGKFKELHVLPAHLVEVVYTGDWNDPVKGYKFNMGDQTVLLPADSVMHLKTWNPNWDLNGSQLRGFSPMSAGDKVLQRNEKNKTAQASAFNNGGSAYLLSSSSESKPMTMEQLEQINDRIKDKIRGAENFRNITATSGLVNAQKIGDTPVDLQLIEADQEDVKRICMLFGVDPVIFLTESATYNNKEQALKSLVSNVVLADLIRFRDKFNQFVLKGYESERLFIEFDTTVFAELQPDLKLMKEVYGQPILSPNEVRSVFNWDAVEEDYMNKYYMEVGMVEMGADISDDDFEKAIKNYG